MALRSFWNRAQEPVSEILQARPHREDYVRLFRQNIRGRAAVNTDRARVDVIGVSPDKMKPIEKFAEKYQLTFPLASDEQHAVAETYGTWVEKSMYGRKYMGMERSTFLIDGAGRYKAWRKVSVTGHAADMLAAAQGLK